MLRPPTRPTCDMTAPTMPLPTCGASVVVTDAERTRHDAPDHSPDDGPYLDDHDDADLLDRHAVDVRVDGRGRRDVPPTRLPGGAHRPTGRGARSPRSLERRGGHQYRGLALRALRRLHRHGAGLVPRGHAPLRPAQAGRRPLQRLGQLRPGPRRRRRGETRERRDPRRPGFRLLGAPARRSGQDGRRPGPADLLLFSPRTRDAFCALQRRVPDHDGPAPRRGLRRGARQPRDASQASPL